MYPFLNSCVSMFPTLCDFVYELNWKYYEYLLLFISLFLLKTDVLVKM